MSKERPGDNENEYDKKRKVNIFIISYTFYFILILWLFRSFIYMVEMLPKFPALGIAYYMV